MKKMSPLSRVIVAIAALLVVVTYFVPVWGIYLTAPQYPEGLAMFIWLNKITGEVEIINGLNHYIGMKHISAEMFPEFTYLVYVVGFFIFFGLVVAVSGNRKLLLTNITLNVLFGIAAMFDFYRWGYDYGHNLDPTAAIQVPGFSYQPPVIGHKQLLNFDAYSYPDVGGWIVIAAALIQCVVFFFEWRKTKRTSLSAQTIRIQPKTVSVMTASFFLLSLSSCNSGPKPFAYGKDICDDCKMTIIEPKFGAEVLTKKGKAYKFDDVHCMAHFLSTKRVAENDIAQTFFINYEKPEQFLNEQQAFFVVSPQLKSPMNSNAAALSTKAAADAIAAKTQGQVKNWSELRPQL